MKHSLILIALLLVFSSAQSATILVPEEQPTIQAGLDSASVGDTVLVSPGIYTGDGNRDLDFGGRNIVLRSEAGPEQTIIDAAGSLSELHRGFIFQNGEDLTAVVDGFTITGGFAASGAGVWCKSSSPTFTNCAFIDNYATLSGAAVRCKSSSPYFRNCTFVNGGAPTGGMVFCLAGSSPSFQNCVMAFGGEGGTIACSDGASEPQLDCCNLYGNVGGDWIDCITNLENTNGNISADPLFCNVTGGDYHLKSNSPCAPENNGCGVLMGVFGVECTATDVPGDIQSLLPEEFHLFQNYPNPFNPVTQIGFALPHRSYVRLELFNLLGQRVGIIEEGLLAAGFHTASWDAGEMVSGVYLYRLTAGSFIETRKMVLLK